MQSTIKHSFFIKVFWYKIQIWCFSFRWKGKSNQLNQFEPNWTNNLLLGSSKDIADDILEIARLFEMNYSCVNVIICGILSHDDSWSVNQVSIKKVNQILKLKCYKSSCTFVSHNRGWTLVDGSLNADLYYSGRSHLVEKGNLKLDESIFNSIEVSNDSNHNNKFSRSYKMAVSFKLNNAEFPPLPFPSTSKPVLSNSASVPFITACKPFPCNIMNRSFAIARNTPISSVPLFSQDNFFRNLYLTLPSCLSLILLVTFQSNN